MNTLVIMNRMNKIFFCIISLFCLTTAMAQESPFVGTWEGTYTIPIDDTKNEQRKVVVRINKYENDYVVRMKTMSAEDPSKVKYWDNLNVTNSSPTSLSWNFGSATSYDCGYVVNGQIVYSADFSYNCIVIFNNGRLSYSYSMHTVYKNRNGSVIGTHDTPTLAKTYLYKEDGNW